jgi:hypothetical protein
MNVRLFLLIAMTAFFGALWSSDQQYQETQMAIARAARERTTQQQTASADRRVAPKNGAPSTLTAPFAASSWVAPTYATPEFAEPIREPLVAPRVEPSVPASNVAPTEVVSMIVSIGRPSFHFDGSRLFSDVRPAAGANPGHDGDDDLAGLFRWVSRVRFEIDGQTCWMRWQFRRTAFLAQRRVIALIRRQVDWRDIVWRDVVQQLTREAFGQLDSPAMSAAVPGMSEER